MGKQAQRRQAFLQRPAAVGRHGSGYNMGYSLALHFEIKIKITCIENATQSFIVVILT